jgi:hypothetical protein
MRGSHILRRLVTVVLDRGGSNIKMLSAQNEFASDDFPDGGKVSSPFKESVRGCNEQSGGERDLASSPTLALGNFHRRWRARRRLGDPI